MIIDKETYKLPIKNYISVESEKNKILIGNTFNTLEEQYNGWLTRWGGEYTKTAMYSIGINGNIYQHFSNKYQSIFTEDIKVNETSVTILLENEGYLSESPIDDGLYVDYIGRIYNRTDSILKKKWRGKSYWAPYTEEQLTSLTILVNDLCNELNISKEVSTNNVIISNNDNLRGIYYRSNLNKYASDVNPSWEFIKFKKELKKL